MTFKHFVPLQESKTDPLLHLAQTLRVIEEFVSFQFSEKVILKFTLKKKKQFLPSLLLLRNPSAHTNSIQWVSHIFKEKCRHSFASPSPCFKGTFQGQFHCQVQYKWKLFDAIEFCPFSFLVKARQHAIKPLQIMTLPDAISHLMRPAASLTNCLFYFYLLHVDTSSWFQVAVHLKDNIIHHFYQAWPIMQIPPKFIFKEKEDWLQRFTICTENDLGGYFNC